MCLSRFKPADWNKFLDVVIKWSVQLINTECIYYNNHLISIVNSILCYFDNMFD